MDLSNKVIWITGASSGIGEALCCELASRGAALAITSRRAELLDELKSKLSCYRVPCLTLPADVTNLEQMRHVAAKIYQEFGRIDMAVANAGTHIESYPERFNSSEYEFIMSTNYGGLLHCFEAAIPFMLEQQQGTLVGISSLAGYRGLPRAAAYGASKSAMIHFMESARFHLQRKGLKVVIVNPGFVKTPLTDKNNFTMPFLISSQRAARYICDGLERERIKITFPPAFAALLEFGRILPDFIYNFIVRKVWERMDRP